MNNIIKKKLNEIDINLLPSNLREELNKLPQHIKDFIVINREAKPLLASTFSKYIGTKDLIEMEKYIMNNSCVKEQSLYDLSYEEIIDGFVMRVIPKGTKLYKTFEYFITEKQIKEYCKENLYKPAWFGNKYVCYAIARIMWGGIVSFTIDKPIYLIDMFNLQNLDKIYNELESMPSELFENYGKSNFLNDFRIIHGYRISLSEKLNLIYNNNKYKYQINVSTDDYKLGYQFNYCKIDTVDNIKPVIYIQLYKSFYYNEQILYKIFLQKYQNIHGIIRRAIKSDLEVGGVFIHEEITLKNNTLLDNMYFDYDDKLCWVNWKKILQYEGIPIIPKLNLLNNYQPSNYKFKQIKYYKKNETKFIKLKKKYIMSYNIHNFVNLNSNITLYQNQNNIINIIIKYVKNNHIVILQELSQQYNNILKKYLHKYYNYIEHAYNGSAKTDKNKLQIVVLSDKKYINKKIILNISLSSKELVKIADNLNKTYNNNYFDSNINYDIITKSSKINRNIIILYTDFGVIACVHLEIGFRNLNLDNKIYKEDNKIINKFNSLMRINMIDKILKYEPDIIIGDFNFTLMDEETKYLQNKNYHSQKYTRKKSTPYNRVDHCFIKNNHSGKNILMRCNYSDHLPMFQSIN